MPQPDAASGRDPVAAPAKTLVLILPVDVPSEFRSRMRRRGWQVAHAGGSEQGLRRAAELRADVVVLGSLTTEVAQRRGLSGIEFCRRLKQDPATAHVRVVMVTSLSGEDHRGKALLSGVDAYVTTPADPDALEHVLADLFELRPEP